MSKLDALRPGSGLHTHLSKEIILQDGRKIQITCGQNQELLDADGQRRQLHLNILNPNNTLHQSLFRIMHGTLSTHSLTYNVAILRAFKAWFEKTGNQDADCLDIKHLDSLLKIPLDYRSFIIPALRRIKNQKLEGLSVDLEDFLQHQHKWEERGNGAYYSLITNDPVRGALTDQELHNLHAALNSAYSYGLIPQSTFTLCWFFIGTGVRPIQIVRMKKNDVQFTPGPEGNEVTLKIPLSKGEKKSKQEYWLRRCPTVLAECLRIYLDSPRMKHLGDDAPLFEGTSNALSMRLTACFEKLDTYSERLEERIPVTPYRFRYTLATRAIAHGASDFEVARLLTHRSTSCIHFYRASMPQLQKPIRQALGKEMEYFAKAFQGRLIQDLNEATRAGDDNAVIADFLRLLGQKVGACGTMAECHQNAPIACLYCPFFEPLADAPWEMLMAALQADQNTESEDRIRLINHNAMSAISEIMERRDLMKPFQTVEVIDG